MKTHSSDDDAVLQSQGISSVWPASTCVVRVRRAFTRCQPGLQRQVVGWGTTRPRVAEDRRGQLRSPPNTDSSAGDEMNETSRIVVDKHGPTNLSNPIPRCPHNGPWSMLNLLVIPFDGPTCSGSPDLLLKSPSSIVLHLSHASISFACSTVPSDNLRI